MVSSSAPGDRTSYRRPWYWLAVVAAVALVAMAGVANNVHARIAANTAAFRAHQRAQLRSATNRIELYLVVAEQLAGSLAADVAHARGASAVQASVRDAFASRENPDVYGAGVFYEPYAMDARVRNFSVYVHGGGRLYGRESRRIGGGLVEVYAHSDDPSEADQSYPWFRGAVARRGAFEVVGPYREDGRSFVTVSVAFPRTGTARGVVAVDALLPAFLRMLAPRPGDVIWIEDPQTGAYRLGTGPIPAPQGRMLAREALAGFRARVVISSDTRGLRARNTHLVALGAVGVMLIALLAFGAGAMLWERWRGIEASRLMRVRQERLEAEVALARRVETELRQAGFIDGLTGLPNRAGFLERLREHLERGGDPATVALLDLDRFNLVNDTLGHAAGDELIRALADRLRAKLPADAFVARLGGDEFGVIHSRASAPPEALAARLLAVIGEPVTLMGQTLHVKASVGVLELDERTGSAGDVIRDADIAVYAAKKQGRARWTIFDAQMRAGVEREARLESELRQAVARGQLHAFYQPIVSVESGAIVSFEALARWTRDDASVVSAQEFVPLAEARGFVYDVDSAVLHDVFSHAATLFAGHPQASVAINLSAAEFTLPGLAERIAALIATHGVDPRRIRLEITETTMMTRGENVRETLDRLREMGIALVLDDFGTGYSSLAYLQRLPLSGVKIDRSFVESLGSDSRSPEIVRSIVAIARTFGLQTTAEGVETREQFEHLRRLGVDFAQGFFFSPAVALADVSSLVFHDEDKVATQGAAE